MLERIAARCHDEHAARAVRAWRPEETLEAARARARRAREAIALAEAGAPLPNVRIAEAACAVERLERGEVLDGKELRTLC